MERKLKKLDAARIAELKKYGVKPLNEESLSMIAGGTYGEPSCCPQCGYEDWWDW